MKCTSDQYMREQLPALGALAGALSTAYVLQRGQEGPYWHPLDRLGASMTVGYLAGLLAAPMIWKPCTPHEKALEEDRSMYGETKGSNVWSKVHKAFQDPNDPCGHIPKGSVETSGTGMVDGRFVPNPEYQACRAKYPNYESPLERMGIIRKGPRPAAETSPDPFNQPLPEGCADWSGRCKDSHVYNTADGSRCPRDPREVQREMFYMLQPCPEHKKTTLDSLKKLPNWVWIAGALGLGLYLGRK